MNRLLILLITSFLLLACNNASEQVSPKNRTVQKFAIPTSSGSVQPLKEGKWQVTIKFTGNDSLQCDNPIENDVCLLAVNSEEGFASSFISVNGSNVEWEITWEYLDPTFTNTKTSDGYWLIAKLKRPNFEFQSADYYPLPDDDNDNISNLVELENRTDPGDAADPPISIAVPDVVNLDEAVAKQAVITEGLQPGTVNQEYSNTVEQGKVIKQNPAAGVLVRLGADIDLTISLGQMPPQTVVVPNCTDLPQTNCENLLTLANLNIGAVSQAYSNTIAAPNIIRTNPTAGTLVQEGSSVDVEISKGVLVIPSPIAYYPFNGNASDASGNNLNGIVSNATLTTDRKNSPNSAYQFDLGANNVGDDITVPNDSLLQITNKITLAAWINTTVLATQTIVRMGPNVNGAEATPYDLSLSGTGDIVFSIRSYPTANPAILEFLQARFAGYPTNSWIFVVGTYDGTNMKLYVNGELKITVAKTGPMNTATTDLLIGTRLNLPADTFNGKIDDIRIFDRALSLDQIQALYQE